MGRHFQCFQRIDVEMLVNEVRQGRSDTGNGKKACFRFQAAAQPVEL